MSLDCCQVSVGQNKWNLQSVRRSWVRCPWVLTPQSLKGFIKALLKSLSVLEALDGSCDRVLVVMSEIFGSAALV